MISLADFFEPYGFTVRHLPDGLDPSRYVYLLKAQHQMSGIAFQYDIVDIDRDFWVNATPKLISIFANNQFPDRLVNYTDKLITEFITSHYLKLSPEEKLDTVLEYIHEHSRFDGELISTSSVTNVAALQMYFSNREEWEFYLNTAIHQGYINKDHDAYQPVYGLTISGLSKVVNILKGKESNICFIAMAFTDLMREVCNDVIKPVLMSYGYQPYTVDSEHYDSDKTINDAILAGIKRAKFTLADFTDHRNGVYFEAGFALGRGQKVIYCCSEDHITQSHFDLRNYQHIVWKDKKDFEKKLKDKIEAFIND